MRILRTYQHVAHDFHFCDRCCRYISPGEIYEGSVEIHGKHFVVYKTHIHPTCDFPEDPDWIEKERREEINFQKNLPFAA